MKGLYLLFAIFCFAEPSFCQLYENCDPYRLGPLAEPVRFRFVHGTPGYYEVISPQATAFTICGEKIEIPKGEVLLVDGDSYEGTFNKYKGVWRVTGVDFDGPGPHHATRVFIPDTHIKQLLYKPRQNTFNDKAYWHTEDSGEYVAIRTKHLIILLAVIGIIVLFCTFLFKVIRNIFRRNGTRSSKSTPVALPYQSDYSSVQATPNIIRATHNAQLGELDTQSAKPVSNEEPEPEEDLDSIFSELNALIGLASVKREVISLANLMKVQKMKRDAGIATTTPNLHLVFTGSAGTGKTTVAQLIGRIYKQIGLLPKGHTIMVSREDLVGEYVGHTAPKTKAVIQRSIGGVLFIDEAYSLYHGGTDSNDFGSEVISTLIQSMENQRGLFAVILAGYSKDMALLLNSNQGLKSRLSNFIDFPDYSLDDLVLIFQKVCDERQHIIGEGVIKKVIDELYRSKEYYQENFGNAREVRTLIERIEKNQSNRLAQFDGLEKIPKAERSKILKTILPEDVKEEIYPADKKSQRIGF